MLKFFGRGSAFSAEQNSAFFVHGDELVLIDCPMSSFDKIRRYGADTLAGSPGSGVSVLVTHTHGDHVGGIPTLIQYMFYMHGRPITVIAPSAEVADDLGILIGRIEGCDSSAYRIITADMAERDWLRDVIPTVHTPQLAGRCFGYRLTVDGENVVYTGDTRVIEPFLPYLSGGTYLYSDASSCNNDVHISVGELLEKTKGYDIRLFLMHLDDPEAIEEMIKGTGAELAPLYV